MAVVYYCGALDSEALAASVSLELRGAFGAEWTSAHEDLLSPPELCQQASGPQQPSERQLHSLSMTTLTHFQSMTLSPCALTRDAFEHARRTWLCGGCASPRPDVGAVDVSLQDRTPGKYPLTFVGGTGVPVARMDFLLEVAGAEAVAKDLLLGKVFDEHGHLLEDWVTFRGRRCVIVRGTANVSYRPCSTCDRQVYFATGKRYVAPAPSKDVQVYETHLFGFAVAGRQGAQWRNPKGVTIEQLPILDHGKDGIAELG